MKEWKNAIVSAIVKESADCKIISLREIAGKAGIRHIKMQDVLDILQGVEKALPDYHPLMLVNPGNRNESLFCTLNFVQNGVEFDSARRV